MNAAPSSVDSGTTEPTGVRHRWPRRRRRRTVVVVVMVVVAGAGAGLAVTRPFGGPARPASIDNGAPTAVANVTRGTLSARTSVNGTLSYAGGFTVINQAHGTYTKVPHAGQIVHSGQVLYRVGGAPVVALTGASAPAYRALSKGLSGTDVQQLNAGLVALGYATRAQLNPRSRTFGAATAYAVKRLQAHLEVKETGRLDLGQAVFLPRDTVRITKVNATYGGPAAPGSPMLQGTSTNRRVSVALDASGQAQVKTGDKVTITLPNGKTTPGTVASVGTVAKKSSSGATINVTITPSNPKATGRLDQAPVSVSIVTGSARNVLTVPVNALLALVGGGYAVEVADTSGTRRLVPVSLGLFDDAAGLVEVSGAGLAAGQRVVVPAS